MRVLKWLLVVALGLFGLVAALAIVGMLLPREHVASRSALYRQRPDAVFAVISDVARAAEWRKSLTAVEMLPPVEGRIRFREVSGGDSITMEIEMRQPVTRMVTRIADPDQPFGGTWTFELAPEGEGTRLAITERGEIDNPIFRVLARFVFGYTSTMDTYLTDLGAKLGDANVAIAPAS